MPKYPANPTYISGFHNSKNTNGVNDRVYSALDMREPYKSIFSDGVKPNANGVLGDDLQVQAVSGMKIRVAAGRGLFGGAFFYNKSIYTIELDTASSTDRYDCIIVRTDDTELVRDTTIVVRSLNHIPTRDDLERNDNVNEYCLGYVRVPALATSISNSNITDTRLDQNLCGVITGVFNQVDGEALGIKFEAAFNEWFDDIKAAFVASATLIHTYTNSVTTTAAGQKEVLIGIPQYNMNTDVLIVSVNGNVFIRGTQYEIVDNSKVSFTYGFPVVGTQVLFQVLKSVDGSQAESVVSQVNTLINQMNSVNKILEFDYYCNGVNDNIQISDIVKEFLNSSTIQSDAQLYLNIHGTFGASNKYLNNNWIVCGGTTTDQTKRVILDFKHCSKMFITMAAGTDNNVFYGVKYEVRNLNLSAVCYDAGCNINVHGSLVGEIKSENCRVEVITTGYACYALCGTHTNNDVMCSSTGSYASCFYQGNYYGAIKVIGGKYRAYTSTNTTHSEVFYSEAAASNGVIVAMGVTCPTNERTYFYQKNSVNVNKGYITAIGLITDLPINTTGATAAITGTIPISKA